MSQSCLHTLIACTYALRIEGLCNINIPVRIYHEYSCEDLSCLTYMLLRDLMHIINGYYCLWVKGIKILTRISDWLVSVEH